MKRHAAVGIILAALAAVGCRAQTRTTTHAFPSTWPGSTPLSEHAPTVSVQPLRIETTGPVPQVPDPQGLPTDAVLSALFVKYLHVNGINAVLERPEEMTARYTVGCSVPQLGYDITEGFPKARHYRAEISCQVKDAQSQAVVWERKLAQRYDETVVLDMMTKLPDQPHRHDRTLYQECIVPLWDAMASSVSTVVASRQALPDAPAADNVPLALP
jgi:hypothetical protein